MATPKTFIPCVRFIDEMVRLDDGSALKLADHQRAILSHALTPKDGHLPYQTILWSEPKKSGKTEIAADVGSWILNTQGPRAEVLVAGNDLEQSIVRVFSRMVRIQQGHPILAGRIVKVTEKLLVLDDGSTARPVALDSAGEAGANPNLVIHDEAWGICSEEARRLYDELTPPPTRPLAFRWVTSYAGYPGESKTLEGLYDRGQKGTPVPGLPECASNGPLFTFWSHTPRMAWQTPAYYARQREDLRSNAYRRLHLNEWVSGESAFLAAEHWDACIDLGLAAPRPDFGIVLFGGMDIAPKNDATAVVTVFWNGDGRLSLGPYRIWRPTSARALDFEAVEAYVRMLHGQYWLRRLLADPFQMASTIGRLAGEGIAIQEYPQTLPNLTKATQGLFDAVESRQLRLYPAADLREQAVENAVAVETSRGLKLEKARASKKIDGVVALSMAVTAALDSPPAPTGPMPILGGSRSQVSRLWPYARGLDAAMESSQRRGDESSMRRPGLILP